MLTTPVLCADDAEANIDTTDADPDVVRKDNIVYKVASTRAELEGAFRVVHNAYMRKGLSRPNPTGMRLLPHHLLPSTDVFVAIHQGKVISTMSLVRDRTMGLPMESVFPEDVARRRRQGLRLAEVSCLADRRKHMLRTLPELYSLMRLLGQAARARGVDQILIACHPRHAKFHSRALGFKAISGTRDYPMVRGNPATALALDLNELPYAHPQLHKRFFGSPIPASALRPRPLPIELKERFESVINKSSATSVPAEYESEHNYVRNLCA